VAEVARWAAEHPDNEWILGGSYDSSLAPDGLFDARWLDEAVADRPVMLRAWDYHTVWCNSLALQLAGVTASSPEPALGEIPRRADGTPLGTMREWGAVDLIAAVVPPLALDTRVAALHRATTYYASLGFTWIQDAWVEPDDPLQSGAAGRPHPVARTASRAARRPGADRAHRRPAPDR